MSVQPKENINKIWEKLLAPKGIVPSIKVTQTCFPYILSIVWCAWHLDHDFCFPWHSHDLYFPFRCLLPFQPLWFLSSQSYLGWKSGAVFAQMSSSGPLELLSVLLEARSESSLAIIRGHPSPSFHCPLKLVSFDLGAHVFLLFDFLKCHPKEQYMMGKLSHCIFRNVILLCSWLRAWV